MKFSKNFKLSRQFKARIMPQVMARLFGFIFFISVFSYSALSNVCITESRGLFFYDTNWDTNHASDYVMRQCHANLLSLGQECVNHLRCSSQLGIPYPSEQINCQTQSHNIGFEGSGHAMTINEVTQDVIGQCQNNSHTNIAECMSNFRCWDAWNEPSPPARRSLCSTQSRGLIFRSIYRTPEQGSQAIFRLCAENPFTLNHECNANLSCVTPFYGSIEAKPTECYTNSRGLQFYFADSQINRATFGVVDQCHSNPYTINNDCIRNLWCRIPDIIPGPVDPRPFTCWLTTPRGRYMGIAPNAAIATIHARNQCLRAWGETSYSCNAGSVVCRQ